MSLSQGSTFSWGGSFGGLTGIAFQSGSADMVDMTGEAAELRGGVEGSAVVKRYVCLGIDPGSVQIKFNGGGFSNSQVGLAQILSVDIGGFTGGGEAVLESFSIEASVGDLVRGTATFRLTGY